MIASSSQEVAVLLPLMISLATTLTAIVVHGVVLAAIVRLVLHEYRLGRTGVHFWRDVGIVASATLLALAAHLLEIAVWAGVLEACGEFTRFAAAFYHSAMNYTSLGYGDVVMSASWKLFGPLETANGMLMFGVSTGTIFAVIQRLFQTKYGEPGVASTPLARADRWAA
jgi:Ion channel